MNTGGGFERRSIPKEAVYAHMVRLFMVQREPARFTEALRYGAPHAAVLAWHQGSLIVKDGLTVKALDVASGRARWTIETTERESPTFVVSAGNDGARPALYRCDRRIERIDAGDGSGKVLSPAASPSGLFDATADGAVAVVEGSSLAFYQGGEDPVWTVPDGVLEVRPVAGRDTVTFGSRPAVVRSVSRADGSVRWTVPVQPALKGLYQAGELLLVDTGAGLTALDPAGGQVRWRVPADDIVVSPPAMLNGRILLATKARVLLLVDPADGAVAATRPWPTWLLDVRVVGQGPDLSRVACADLRNRVTFLDPATLAPVSEVVLAHGLRPPLLFAPEAPVTWALPGTRTGGDMVSELIADSGDRRPACLCLDDEGFVYVVPVPGEGGGR
jgi:hypothetical protein